MSSDGARAWNTPPPGCVSVTQAATRLDVSRQYVDKLIRRDPSPLEVEIVQHPNGRRRIWVRASSLRTMVTEHAEHDVNHNANRSQSDADRVKAAEAERDLWRARALRVEHAQLDRDTANDLLIESLRQRIAAEKHLRRYTEEVAAAHEQAVAAGEHYRAALDAFQFPTDLAEAGFGQDDPRRHR